MDAFHHGPPPARRQQGPARAASSTGSAKRGRALGLTARSAWQNNPFCTLRLTAAETAVAEHIGGSGVTGLTRARKATRRCCRS